MKWRKGNDNECDFVETIEGKMKPISRNLKGMIYKKVRRRNFPDKKLLTVRIALCAPPPILHNKMCLSRGCATCIRSWESFWASEIVPKLLKINGEAGSRLFTICKLVESAKVPGMMEKCTEQTITDVTERPGWDVEWNIPDGVVRVLMVAERVMLAPGDVSDDVPMAEGTL